MFLIDMNIIFEVHKCARCDARVAGWYAGIEDAGLYLSVLVTGEIRKGIESARPRFHRTRPRSGSSSGADPAGRTREAQPLGRPMQRLALCACEVDAEPVFDALDAERRRALGVLDSHLACLAWEAEMLAGSIPASQSLADRLIGAGYAGRANPQLRRRGRRRRSQSRHVDMGCRATARVVLIDDEGRLSGSPIH